MANCGFQPVLTEDETKKLRWRSRRGMLELDLLLLPFVDNVLPSLSSVQQAAFVRLLDQDDPDLMSWFSHQSKPADTELAELVALILEKH